MARVASAIVSGAMNAAKIALDKASLEIRLDVLEKDAEFLGASAASIVSRVMSTALAGIRNTELPTVAKYAEIYDRYDRMMVSFRDIVEKDIDTIRKVSDKIEQADHHN